MVQYLLMDKLEQEKLILWKVNGSLLMREVLSLEHLSMYLELSKEHQIYNS